MTMHKQVEKQRKRKRSMTSIDGKDGIHANKEKYREKVGEKNRNLGKIGK